VISVGYYGKLPDRGDFISKNISTELEQALHRLGSSLIAYGRDRHGDAFAAVFSEMPLFAIVAGSGVMIDRSISGVFGPSADAVGRLFPFFVITDAPHNDAFVETEGITKAAAIIDAAAFERLPLDDVENRLADVTLTAPIEMASLWLSQWSVSGPQSGRHEFEGLDDLCSRGLEVLLTPQGAS